MLNRYNGYMVNNNNNRNNNNSFLVQEPGFRARSQRGGGGPGKEKTKGGEGGEKKKKVPASGQGSSSPVWSGIIFLVAKILKQKKYCREAEKQKGKEKKVAAAVT